MRRYFVLLAILCSCQLVTEDENVVASAYDRSLTWEELMSVIPDASTPEDSAFLAERYIQNWLKEQVILEKAENSLSESQKEFDKQLANYRNSLLTYAFENEVIRQKLDTVVSTAEIEEYYNENIKNFVLKDYIVKVRFCIADSLEKELSELRRLVFSDNPEDLVALESLCVNRGIQYYIHEDRWIRYDELLNNVPLDDYDVERFLKKNKTLEFQKNKRVFFVKIIDYQLKDGVSPLELERENIRNILLNQRKLALLGTMRNDLMNEARKKNKIHTYYE